MANDGADGQATGSGLSQMERVVDTFVAPSKTFTDILRSTTWWLPFLLAVVVSMGFAYTIDKQVGFDRVVENQIQTSQKQQDSLSGLTPEQRTARVHQMSIGYRYSTYASPVFILIFTAIGALGLWATFNFVLGAQTTFGQMFCLWMYCALPRVVSALLAILTLCLGGNAEGFDLKNPVGTNLAYYLTDAAPWLKTALSFFDLISVWVILLLILGTAIVAKVSKGKAAAVILGWWLVIFVLSVAATAAFS